MTSLLSVWGVPEGINKAIGHQLITQSCCPSIGCSFSVGLRFLLLLVSDLFDFWETFGDDLMLRFLVWLADFLQVNETGEQTENVTQISFITVIFVILQFWRLEAGFKKSETHQNEHETHLIEVNLYWRDGHESRDWRETKAEDVQQKG